MYVPPPPRRFRLPIDPALRLAVYRRDRFRCVSCDRKVHHYRGTLWRPLRATLDHRVPWADGGEDTYENLRTMCAECNEARGRDR